MVHTIAKEHWLNLQIRVIKYCHSEKRITLVNSFGRLGLGSGLGLRLGLEQNKAEQNRTKQSRTEQSRTEQSTAKQSRALP